MFEGGSIGQGTTVPGHYDVDLVLYSRSKACKRSNKTVHASVQLVHVYISQV